MPCQCCQQAVCCKNGYPTVTFTISNAVKGPNQCDGTDQWAVQCQNMNGSYVFSAEDVANGTINGNSLSRQITLRDQCTFYIPPQDPVAIALGQGRWVTLPPLVATLNFALSCKGDSVRFDASISAVSQVSTAYWWLPYSTGVALENKQVDPEDGCVISATHPASSAVRYYTFIPNYSGGQGEGLWGLCPGVKLTVTVTR